MRRAATARPAPRGRPSQSARWQAPSYELFWDGAGPPAPAVLQRRLQALDSLADRELSAIAAQADRSSSPRRQAASTQNLTRRPAPFLSGRPRHRSSEAALAAAATAATRSICPPRAPPQRRRPQPRRVPRACKTAGRWRFGLSEDARPKTPQPAGLAGSASLRVLRMRQLASGDLEPPGRPHVTFAATWGGSSRGRAATAAVDGRGMSPGRVHFQAKARATGSRTHLGFHRDPLMKEGGGGSRPSTSSASVRGGGWRHGADRIPRRGVRELSPL